MTLIKQKKLVNVKVKNIYNFISTKTYVGILDINSLKWGKTFFYSNVWVNN